MDSDTLCSYFHLAIQGWSQIQGGCLRESETIENREHDALTRSPKGLGVTAFS